MRRGAIITGLALLVALALVPAGASAASLTEERATVLATKLGRQVAKERDVRYWRIQRLVKRRTNRFVFEYFERLKGDANRFCKAFVVVQQRGSRRTATMQGSRCGTMRAEVLALESAIDDAISAIEPKAQDIRSNVDAYSEEIEDCVQLDVPIAYENEVDDFLELGAEPAIFDVVMPELGTFRDRLVASGVTDPALARGVTSWRKYLEMLAELPPVTRDACPALVEWARDDWADESVPVDFDRTSALLRSLTRHGRVILDASDRLYAFGVSDRIYAAFTPYGLVTTAARFGIGD